MAPRLLAPLVALACLAVACDSGNPSPSATPSATQKPQISIAPRASIHPVEIPKRGMSEDQFWTHIALLDGRADGEEDIAPLVGALRREGRDAAIAFAETLAAVLYELDRRSLATQPVYFEDEPEDFQAHGMSDDVFLYFRAAIVAAGREVFEHVLSDESFVLSRHWPWGEWLLSAADEAGGFEPGSIETTYSFETASNDDYW